MTAKPTQDELRRLVDAHVHYCLSALVHTLAKSAHGAIASPDHRNPYLNESIGETMRLCDQAAELFCPIPDYEEAAIQDGAKLHYREDDGRWCVLDQNETDLWDSLFDSAEEAAEAYCLEHDVDPYEREIFEHWAVSDWLADKLEERGERIDHDFAGLTVWGRTTTGQAIYMDSVIADIWRDCQHADSEDSE